MQVKTHKYWDYFVVTLFVFTTGSVIWFQRLGPALAHIIYFIVAILNCYISPNKYSAGHVSKTFFSYIILVCLLSVLSLIVQDAHLQENSMQGFIVGMVSSYLIISRYDFYYFRHLLTNVVYFIALIGIPVFLLTEANVLPLYSINVNSTTYEMFLVYAIGWPTIFHRFAGIWHEPGACQIILNTVLWLHLYEIRTWSLDNRLKFKLAVILIASVLTLSTGGYIILMLFALSCIWKLKLKKSLQYKIYPLLIVLFFIVIYSLVNSATVQNKFSEDSVSLISRTSDNLALAQMTLERPLFGYGLGTDKFWERSAELGNVACSNGLLTGIASLGLIWLITYIFISCKTIKKMQLGVPVFLVLLAFIIMQSNERFLEFPITYLFVFSFYSNNQLKYERQNAIN